jgi:hypothetical protein
MYIKTRRPNWRQACEKRRQPTNIRLGRVLVKDAQPQMRYYTALVLKNLAVEWNKKKADRVAAKRVRKVDR